MLLLALAGVANEQTLEGLAVRALQQQVAAQQAQLAALQAQVASRTQERPCPAPHSSHHAPPSHYSRYDHANGALKSMRSHPMFQKLRAMKKQAAYGLGQSQIAANEAISGVKTDPSELKDEFKPGAA